MSISVRDASGGNVVDHDVLTWAVAMVVYVFVRYAMKHVNRHVPNVTRLAEYALARLTNIKIHSMVNARRAIPRLGHSKAGRLPAIRSSNFRGRTTKQITSMHQ
jgi:hypothetical protein